MIRDIYGFNDDECLDEFLDDSLVDFDDESRISDDGYDVLKDRSLPRSPGRII